MILSGISGITTKRTITDLDLNNYDIDLRNTKTTAVLSPKTNTNLKTLKVSPAYYAKLGSSMPAVAFIRLSVAGFLTDAIPPKYIQSFSCERVSNTVGKFSLNLICPIDTFKPQTDDLNVKLINLFGHIDSNSVSISGIKSSTGESTVNATPCSLSYGWRKGTELTSVKYDNAFIYSMKVDYSARSYYTYVIQGYVNDISEKSHTAGVKILSYEELQSIDTTNMSSSAIQAMSKADAASVLTSTKVYQVRVPVNSTIYEKTSNGTIKSTGKVTSAENIFRIPSNKGSSNNGWTDDNLYVYRLVFARRGDYREYYARNQVILQEVTTGGDTLDNINDDTFIEVQNGLNLSEVNEGERISDKIEILANYLFGKTYDVEVAHTDAVFTAKTPIASLTTSVEVEKTAPDDALSSTLNETTTSWYTWLVHMVSACRDTSEQDAYTANELIDTDGDGEISKDDLETLYTIDTAKIKSKWSKFGIETIVTDGRSKLQPWSTKALSETEFNKYYKSYTAKIRPNISDYLKSNSNDINSASRTFTYVASYNDYLADYNLVRARYAYESSITEVNELLETYDGAITKGASAIQYHIHFIDAAAGRKAKIYIGPTRTDSAKYQYVVGNNSRDSTVLEFSTSEDLVYLISAAKSYMTSSDNDLYIIDPDTGATVKSKLQTASSQIASNEDYAAMVANHILEKVSTGHLSANLTVLADTTSRTVQVTDNITVRCMTNGGKSLFTGTYVVMGVTDNLDNNVLKTTMNLNFTQSAAFDTLKNIILSHLNSATKSN